MDDKVNRIKEYWNDQAALARSGSKKMKIIDPTRNVFADSSGGGTMKDWRIRELEINAFVKYLNSLGTNKVLDIGCGNGYATTQLALRTDCTFIGLDYSSGMIDNAQTLLSDYYPELIQRISYIEGDVLDLKSLIDEKFDVVLTQRCLINLVGWDAQKEALKQISSILKPDGLFLMLEGSIQGLAKLNEIRNRLGQKDITSPWHNDFFDENELLEFTAKFFETVTIDNFCSMYMLISRALHPKLVEPEEPKYDADINDFALLMPNCGDYGYLKLFVMKNKGQY